MSFWQTIGGWFKGLFTAHNGKAIAKVAEDVAVIAADASSGNIPAAVLAATQLPTDASNIVVHAAPTVPATPEKK